MVEEEQCIVIELFLVKLGILSIFIPQFSPISFQLKHTYEAPTF